MSIEIINNASGPHFRHRFCSLSLLTRVVYFQWSYETFVAWGVCLAGFACSGPRVWRIGGSYPDHLSTPEYSQTIFGADSERLEVSRGSPKPPGGGWWLSSLAKPPKEITLAAIVRHVEGALAPVSCVSERFYEKCSCPDESRCAIRSVMKEIREAVVRVAERVTIAELCQRWRKLQQEPMSELDFVI